METREEYLHNIDYHCRKDNLKNLSLRELLELADDCSEEIKDYLIELIIEQNLDGDYR